MRLNKSMFNVLPSPEDKRDWPAKNIVSGLIVDDEEFSILDLEQIKIYNQKQSSMCTGFAHAQDIRLHEFRESKVLRDFSPAYSYGNRINGYDGEGDYLRDTIKQLSKHGLCELKYFDMLGIYPEVKKEFGRLSSVVHENAVKHKIKSYYRINVKNPEEVKKVLKNYKTLITISIPICSSFTKSYKDGVVPIPDTKKEEFYGGHAVVIYGYKMINGKLHYCILNSWGADVGDNGIFYIPYDYPIYEMWMTVDYKKISLELQDGKKEIRVNGDFKTLDVAPFIQDNRMFVPVRFIAEYMGYEVGWDNKAKEVRITEYISNVYMYLGEKSIINSYTFQETDMDVAPVLKDNRVFVPVRFVAEALGLAVTWNNQTKTALISNY